MSKRTLDSFFAPAAKRPRPSDGDASSAPARLLLATLAPSSAPPSTHPTYPFPVARLPPELEAALAGCPAKPGSSLVKPALGLDLLHFQPFVPAPAAHALFEFLRARLFFYRVRYPIKRDGVETLVNTPRFTTVFGVDATARFEPDGALVEAASGAPIKPGTRYSARPRPLPQPLAHLAALVSRATGAEYNFCLVNYYATGQDSIAWHADDEAFLGRAPTIASLSLSEGARREFRMKPKPPAAAATAARRPGRADARDPHELRFALAPGEMVVMRGETQARWLHALPKRADAGGRINITFRRAVVRGGTENYYRYNVGSGGVWRWDERRREMVEMEDATNGENAPTTAFTKPTS